MARPRVILADDHAVLREGLVHVLRPTSDVVAAVSDGRALVSEVERLRPDVVVLDIGMPLLNGIEAAVQIRSLLPSAKLIFLTQQSGKEYLREAFRVGAAGYVLKNAAVAELASAITEALAGRRYLSAELRQRFGDWDPAWDGNRNDTALTPRQREVLQLVAEGKAAKEVAAILGISVKTVEFHKASIMDELGLRTTAELTRYAMEHRIVVGDLQPASS